MGWDGSGNINRTDGTRSGSNLWVQNRDASVKILATLHDNADEDMASAIENCITRDGQNSPSNDLPMNTRKHTNVGAASAYNQYTRVDQVQKSSFSFAGTGGTASAYTLTLSPAPLAYSAGLTIKVQFHATNSSGATINVNGLGTQNMYAGSVALPAGTCQANLIYEFVHNGSSGFFLTSADMGLTTYTPTYGAGGSMTFTSVTSIISKYQERSGVVDLFLDFTGTTGGTASNTITFSLPVNATSAGYNCLAVTVRDGVGVAKGGYCIVTGTTGSISFYDNSNFTLGGTRGAWVSGSYMRA